MIKCCIVGSHCTGKSTLIEALKKESFIQVKGQKSFESLELLSSPTRMIKEKGFKINNDQEDYSVTQLLCMTYDIQNFYLNKNFISDRGALDTLIYTKYLYEQKKVDERTYRLIEMQSMPIIFGYTHIFYIGLEIPLVGDNVRSTDVDFRNRIDGMFNEKFSFWNSNFMPVFERVYCLHGTVEERIEQIKEHLAK